MALGASSLPVALLAWCAAAIESRVPLQATGFSTYPGYTGSLSITGTVHVGQEGDDTQVLFFTLEGTDPRCGTADISLTPNACGVHIHAGTECADAGPHLFAASLSPDPWLAVTYSSQANGGASGQNVRVKTDLPLTNASGRTFVVHDVTGARVACAPLVPAVAVQDSMLQVKSFVMYPGYAGNLAVEGEAVLTQVGTGSDAGQVVAFNLTGVDTRCGVDDITGVSNACGIHVHVGSTCENASAVGGHYWNSTEQAVDPWRVIEYTATPAGVAMGVTVPAVSGVTSSDVLGRTLIVHDATGGRIACGKISEAGGFGIPSGAQGAPSIGLLSLVVMALAVAK